MLRIFSKISLLFAAGYLFFARAASAALFDIWRGTGPKEGLFSGKTCNIAPGGCSLCDGLTVAINLVNDLTTAAIAVTVAMIVYGAIRMMISGGSETAVKEAKGIITSAVIGLVVVLCGWLIINTVLHIIADPGNPLPWANVKC